MKTADGAAKCPHNAAKSDDSTIAPAPWLQSHISSSVRAICQPSAAASAITTIAYASSCTSTSDARASYYAIRDAHSLSASATESGAASAATRSLPARDQSTTALYP